MNLGIGIDTGGTYTDALIYDFDSKKILAKTKTPTTKGHLELGIGKALDNLPSDLIKKAKILSLSTTLATNACVENKGGKAQLVLIGTSQKTLDWIDAKTLYGLNNADLFCIENKEEIDWDSLIENKKDWLKTAQSIAITELNATENGGVIEEIAKEKLSKEFKVPYITGNELAMNLNIMERGATALLNAKLLPVIDEFMSAVKKALDSRDIDIKEMIVRSDGSLMPENIALNHPVKTILSGPAASVIGSRALTNSNDSLIVDMGGTTTDISIVQNGNPAMTDGIRIGNFKTQVKGVFIDTFGLGGDSRITLKNNKPVLGTRRVQPLCMAAIENPQIKDELRELLDSIKISETPLYEFLYLIREPKNLSYYNEFEIDLIEKLKEKPLMLGSEKIDLYKLSRNTKLEDEGIIMRAGLTPTDIMHIKGDFDMHDKEASLLALRYFQKVMSGFEDTQEDTTKLCDIIYDLVSQKLYENIIRIMLLNKNPKLFKNGFDNQILSLITQTWKENTAKEYFALNFNTKAKLIGIGAPTHIFLPKVAKVIGTDYIIPEHAEVANAFGAIVADISAEVKIDIAPIHDAVGIIGYNVYSQKGTETFITVEEAEEHAKNIAKELAIKKARERGAIGELNIEVKANPNNAFAKDSVLISLRSSVVATATGRI
ncbi:MAG: hydantoinase/oxoprolinase family protein [Clostridia bacterium]